MSTTMNAPTLKDRIYAVICPLCTERRADGSCGLERIDECPIATHLDALLLTAVTVESPGWTTTSTRSARTSARRAGTGLCRPIDARSAPKGTARSIRSSARRSRSWMTSSPKSNDAALGDN